MAKPPKPLPPSRQQPKPEPVKPKKVKPQSVFNRTKAMTKNKKRKTQVFPR
jgi:hypothetical protein